MSQFVGFNSNNFKTRGNIISALWDFVRIIYQKQNRLKFIIMIAFN